MNQSPNKNDAKPDRDDVAAWVIGPYLVAHVVLLSWVWVTFWIQASPAQPVALNFGLSIATLSPQDFAAFRQLVLAACSAGIGGAVFMIREFYLSYAYGKDIAGKKEFLKNHEIPRYVLLPFSSVVLGPVAIFLLQAGAIAFVGTTGNGKIPDYTVAALGFLFGFSYHDILDFLRKTSRKILETSEKQGKERTATQSRKSARS